MSHRGSHGFGAMAFEPRLLVVWIEIHPKPCSLSFLSKATMQADGLRLLLGDLRISPTHLKTGKLETIQDSAYDRSGKHISTHIGYVYYISILYHYIYISISIIYQLYCNSYLFVFVFFFLFTV